MDSIVITSALRTAVGKMGGTLVDIQPEELAKIVIEKIIKKTDIDKSKIEEVVFGQAKQSTDAANIARVASLMAGLPEKVPGNSINRACGSGMQAIINGFFQIKAGYGDIILSGGVESMSNAPFYLRKARYGYKAGNGVLVDSNTESQPRSQPEDVYGRLTMGMTAENLAEMYNITREEQDRFAYESQIKAVTAIDKGKFVDEIVPVEVKKRKETIVFKVDEFPRRNANLEKMAKLRAVFKENGTVTAGNSSGRNDGAAAVLVMSENKAKELGLKPLVRIKSVGVSGVDPRIMGIGPVEASNKALKKAGLKLSDIGLIELNEAFAAQSLACIKEMNLDRNIVNVNGGAIALGHPLGASGVKITVTLIHEMIRQNVKYGLSTLCCGGGQGTALILENLMI
jgi:acetyl-CoA C-acetyltransferase